MTRTSVEKVIARKGQVYSDPRFAVNPRSRFIATLPGFHEVGFGATDEEAAAEVLFKKSDYYGFIRRGQEIAAARAKAS